MGGVDIKYEKMAAQKILKKMSYVIRQGQFETCYLILFFHLIYMTLVNSRILYKMIYIEVINFVDYKLNIAKPLICHFKNPSQNTPATHSSRCSDLLITLV